MYKTNILNIMMVTVCVVLLKEFYIRQFLGAPLATLTEYFRDQFLQVSLTKSCKTHNYICRLLRPNSFSDKATSKKLVVPGVVIQKG